MALISVIAYLSCVAFNLNSGGTWFFLFVALCIILITRLLHTQEDDSRAKVRVIGAIVGVGIALLLTAFATSSTFTRASAYQSLLTPWETAVELPKLNVNNAPLVSEHMAMQAAQKLLSIDPGMGSQVVIGNMEKQILNGKLVWIGFLEHQSFSRWLFNNTTGGYVVVSATDPSDARIVSGLKLKYLSSGYFNNDIERAAWLSAPTKLLTDFTPSINPEGKPLWVITTYENTVGISGGNATGIMLFDPQTGESTLYSLKDTPEWVNRIQPASFIYNQVHDYGSFIHGWFNDVFSGQDVTAVSGGVDLIYGENNRAYWYLAMTSKGSDNGITGYFLIDSRTKEAFWTGKSGANDQVASEAVIGLVREKNYHATNPLIFDVLGHPTYVMALTDSTGITRGYGLVNLSDYQTAVFGQTLMDAERLYASKLSKTKSTIDAVVSDIVATGQIKRIGSDVRGGNTTYFVVVEGIKPILTATTDVSYELPILSIGDKITVHYMAGNQPTSSISALEKK
jgi:hypothetical protein